MSIPRFFVPQLDASAVEGELSPRECELPEAEAHHATRVLRLESGAEIAVFDGRGASWTARITSTANGRVIVALSAQEDVPPEPRVALTLGIGLLKHDQMDEVVRDATMLGVTAIVPMRTAHVTVPERAWKGTRVIERWKRVAVASAKQCRRAVVPVVRDVSDIHDVIAQSTERARYISVEPLIEREITAKGDMRAGDSNTSPPDSALLLVGPEGGWSREEVDAAMRAGFAPLLLGPRTLRAERAPIVAISSLWTRWGW